MTTRFEFEPLAEVEAIRAQLDHPVIDADGHLTEHSPLLLDLMEEEVGPAMAARVRKVLSTPDSARPPATVFGTPTKNTLDRATSILPELLRRRLDEFGIDYALLYPGLPLVTVSHEDEEVRRAVARGANRYYAEVFGPHADRLQAVAVIPTFTPEEALDELEHAVVGLGLKAVMLGGIVPERQPSGEITIRGLGHGSPYDYDPVWQRCLDLGVAPGFHTVGRGLASRASTTNYVYNHLGHFAWAQETACRSLIFGGVPKRFPDLRFAFLEGGVGWGCQLYADMLTHFEKRNREAIMNYDPSALDVALLDELFERYAPAAMRPTSGSARPAQSSTVSLDEIDDFAEAGITSPDDIVDMFTRQFFFGCEGGDAIVPLAFQADVLPFGRRLRAMFASDIGHWDVTDMRYVLVEPWELVERGTIDLDDFRAFTCSNVVEMLTSTNPDFFAGTAIADDVAPYTAGASTGPRGR
ncbi:MAG: amidohydrolase family protein [Acidimicrobiia bacterium]